ncbi:MAG: hypothetical protein JWN77_1990, partial [Frankiales bacterium]|nr:hypothetical protein [Frankiales bacterium]
DLVGGPWTVQDPLDHVSPYRAKKGTP